MFTHRLALLYVCGQVMKSQHHSVLRAITVTRLALGSESLEPSGAKQGSGAHDVQHLQGITPLVRAKNSSRRISRLLFTQEAGKKQASVS